jgi:hypothetical protein
VNHRRARLLVALAVTLALAAPAVVVTGAAAQTANPCNATDSDSQIRLTVNSPTSDNPPAFKSSEVPFSGTAEHNGSAPIFPPGPDPQLRNVHVDLVSCSTSYDAPPNSPNLVSASPNEQSFGWSQTFPRNGHYQASIVAQGDQNQTTVRVRRFTVEAPPAPPSGVSAAAVSSKQVDVTWAYNSEPDIQGYEVWRRTTSSSTLTKVTTTTAAIRKTSDTTVGPGNYIYAVRAIRPDGSGAPNVYSADSTDNVTVASPNTPTTTAPPAAATTTTTPSGSTGGGSGSGSGAGTTAGSGSGAGTGSGSTTGTAGSAASPGSAGTIDLSNFAALLDSRRRATDANTTEADPGFGQTLPFQVGDEPAVGADGSQSTAGESARNLGSSIDNGSDRRRSFGFLAGGLLLFVMSMSLLFVRGEVKRVDLLEALEPLEPEAEAGPAEATPAAHRRTRRRAERETIDVSPLDVPVG